MMRFAAAVVVMLTLAGVAFPAEVTMEEIARANEEARTSITSGRISYRVEFYKSPSFLDVLKQRERKMLQADVDRVRQMKLPHVSSPSEKALEHFDAYWKMTEHKLNATTDIDFVFDQAADSSKSRIVDTEDVGALAEQLGLDPVLRTRFGKTVTTAIVKDICHRYQSGPNALRVETRSGQRVDSSRLLETGFLQDEEARHLSNAGVTDDPQNPDLVRVRFNLSGIQGEYILDRTLGFRVRERRLMRDGKITYQEKFDYRTWGDQVFLSSFEKKQFNAEENVSSSERYTITSAELNVPVDASEFEVDVPPSASIFDTVHDVVRTRPAPLSVDVPQAVLDLEEERIADDLLAQTPQAQAAEPVEAAPDAASSPVPVVEDSPAPAPDEVPPAEPGRSHALAWVLLAAALV
ncbi:MAG: hypothetical protein J7M19_06355, partial [Planctomycetes bacterium]|nr:hypothetical protein [Planctomycetota bacterium]